MSQSIRRQLKQLRTITPDASWKQEARSELLRQIRVVRPVEQQPTVVSVWDYCGIIAGTVRQSFFQPVVVMLLLMTATLGSSFVVNAAYYSLPGDNLYTVKLSLEKAQLALTSSQERQVELQIEFAQKRITELRKVAVRTDVTPQQRQEHLSSLVRDLKVNVNSVNQHIAALSSKATAATPTDQKRDASLRMALTLSAETSELAKDIQEKVTQVPEVTQDEEVKVLVDEVRTSVGDVQKSAAQLLATVQQQAAATSTATSTSVTTETQATSTAPIRATTTPSTVPDKSSESVSQE